MASRPVNIQRTGKPARRAAIPVTTKNPHRAPCAEDMFRQAVRLHQQARLDEAQDLYRRTIESDPVHFHALHLLGVIALQRHQPGVALEFLAKALTIDAGNATALLNHAIARHQLEDFEGALVSYEMAIALKPEDADVHFNRGLTLSALRRREDAIASYDRAISVNPNHADAYFNRGNEWQSLGGIEAAIASYDRAIALQPGFFDAHLNRGSALIGSRRYYAALEAFDQAIALRPDHAPGYFNRAGALQHLGEYVAAVASYETALSIDPNYADAHANRGRALRELRRYEAAIASYDKAISLTGDCASLRADRRHLMMQVCDWAELSDDLARIEADLSTNSAASNPFYLLALSDSPAVQRRAAEKWVREHYPPIDSRAYLSARHASERIHLGYFSTDYHEHATAYLIAQLFELHDRSRFRISAFSFGPDSNGPMRKRLRNACDEFIDVRHCSDGEAVAIARNRRIDIAIDLKGFTAENRAGIFARRAAPLQVNYLGFPGTMGASYMDYLVADLTLIPEESRPHYAEKIIYLPHSYQANDATRKISDRVPSRAELGLPECGFVYCCFNNSYKILPFIFDRWMRVLTRVEDSVLWLLGDNSTAMRNLRREAEARKVSPQRLVFADRIDLADHLARHRRADLFLDTLPCNAHTTASDALWAGVPVLTCSGESFAARVSASLLRAIGMPELIVPDLERYEELAVHLGTHSGDLDELRRRLSANRLTMPLFDSLRHTRDLEAAFIDLYHRSPTNRLRPQE